MGVNSLIQDFRYSTRFLSLIRISFGGNSIGTAMLQTQVGTKARMRRDKPIPSQHVINTSTTSLPIILNTIKKDWDINLE